MIRAPIWESAMVRRRQFRVMAAVGIGCVTLSPWRAAAQRGTENSAKSANATLEEIIVTAQRREEKLQQTPVSVVSLSARELEDRSVTNLGSLQYFVPNLTFA